MTKENFAEAIVTIELVSALVKENNWNNMVSENSFLVAVTSPCRGQVRHHRNNICIS
jgi:hypothetical protein